MSSKISSKIAVCLALAAGTLAQPALAEERKVEGVKTYERKVTDNWSVVGIAYPGRERDDVCVAYKDWKDGSRMELVKDLKTGELRLWHQTMGWNRINDEKMKDYTLRMNFHDAQGNVVDGGAIDYKLITKNTLVIANIGEKRFMKAFVNSNRLNLIPDGNASNTQAYFDGKANDIATVMADCVQAYGRAPRPAGAAGREMIEPPSLDLPTRAALRYPL